MEVMSNKIQMSIDVKTLLSETIIKYIAFYHIIYDMKDPKNDLLASDGPLCHIFVMINAKKE